MWQRTRQKSGSPRLARERRSAGEAETISGSEIKPKRNCAINRSECRLPNDEKCSILINLVVHKDQKQSRRTNHANQISDATCTNRNTRSVKQIFISEEKTQPAHQQDSAKFNQVLPLNCFELSLCAQEGIVHKRGGLLTYACRGRLRRCPP